jgi:hypothetical protein
MSERIATIRPIKGGYKISIAYTAEGCLTTWQILEVHKLVIDPKILEEKCQTEIRQT